MKLWSFTVSIAAVCLITSHVTAMQGEPLCQTKECRSNEVCRVLERCTPGNSCTKTAICLMAEQSNYYSGGCQVGEPLLIRDATGQFDFRSCYTNNLCPDGFLCSTALQDVGSRCCRASAPDTKRGSCRAPENRETFFCVDQCLSDADCFYSEKCCQTISSCPHRSCTPPDPCSLKSCPMGSRCAVDPDFNAHCVGSNTGSNASPPPPLPLNSSHRLPRPRLRPRPRPGPFSSCPPLLQPVAWALECHISNRCMPAAPAACRPGKSCCPSFYCGFICRNV